MKRRSLPDIQYLKECFRYSQETGQLFWIDRPRNHFNTDRGWRTFNHRNAGTEAGVFSHNPDGTPKRIMICAGYKKYPAHALIWKMIRGPFDEDLVIDHKDGNPFNNRMSNLRLATTVQNSFNLRVKKNNTSGISGVSFHKGAQKWVAQLQVDGRNRYLGLFQNMGDAAKARREAEVEYFGEYRRVA